MPSSPPKDSPPVVVATPQLSSITSTPAKVKKPQKVEFYDPLKIDVFGNPRSEKVVLPAVIRMSKPGAEPNEKFVKVEGATRRTLKTASTAPLTQINGKALCLLKILQS